MNPLIENNVGFLPVVWFRATLKLSQIKPTVNMFYVYNYVQIKMYVRTWNLRIYIA